MSTTETTAAAPAAGWYPDPSGRHDRRWWDGDKWTIEVADRADPSDPAADPDPDPDPDSGSGTPSVLVAAGPHLGEGAATRTVEPTVEPTDPLAGFDQLKPQRRPVQEQAPTGGGQGPGRRTVVMMVLGALVVAGLLLWGYENYTSAARWRDRGEDLTERLETATSNADAVERALNRAASRGARMGDSQRQMAELNDATAATIAQLDACGDELNRLLVTVQTGGDPTTDIDRANRVCGQAGANGRQLQQILDALQVT